MSPSHVLIYFATYACNAKRLTLVHTMLINVHQPFMALLLSNGEKVRTPNKLRDSAADRLRASQLEEEEEEDDFLNADEDRALNPSVAKPRAPAAATKVRLAGTFRCFRSGA